LDWIANDYSNRIKQSIVELPNFAVDFSEFALAAMIERKSESFDLWMSVFFLCHSLLEPKGVGSASGAVRVSPQVQHLWQKTMLQFEATRYYENGERIQQTKYYCKITHIDPDINTSVNGYPDGYSSYTVEGRFLPNRLTPDSNSNRRLDIFRCKMKDTHRAYRYLARSNAVARVEILKGNTSLLTFRVPWNTRQTGYLLSPAVSLWDPWTGFDPAHIGTWSHDNLYMCVPGMETPPSKSSLPVYLEFIQHHLLLGVNHIFLSSLFAWNKTHMDTMLRVLDSFIKEGSVSMSSSSGDNFDYVYSTAGLVWSRDNVKNFFVNFCTYFSKGVADYVAVW
jgi:hypothetical protein